MQKTRWAKKSGRRLALVLVLGSIGSTLISPPNASAIDTLPKITTLVGPGGVPASNAVFVVQPNLPPELFATADMSPIVKGQADLLGNVAFEIPVNDRTRMLAALNRGDINLTMSGSTCQEVKDEADIFETKVVGYFGNRDFIARLVPDGTRFDVQPVDPIPLDQPMGNQCWVGQSDGPGNEWWYCEEKFPEQVGNPRAEWVSTAHMVSVSDMTGRITHGKVEGTGGGRIANTSFGTVVRFPSGSIGINGSHTVHSESTQSTGVGSAIQWPVSGYPKSTFIQAKFRSIQERTYLYCMRDGDWTLQYSGQNMDRWKNVSFEGDTRPWGDRTSFDTWQNFADGCGNRPQGERELCSSTSAFPGYYQWRGNAKTQKFREDLSGNLEGNIQLGVAIFGYRTWSHTESTETTKQEWWWGSQGNQYIWAPYPESFSTADTVYGARDPAT